MSANGGDYEEDGAKPLRQPRKGRDANPKSQSEDVYLLFAAVRQVG